MGNIYTYSFNQARTELNTSTTQPAEYFLYRGYAFLDGNPFSGGSYGPYDIGAGGSEIRYCTECFTLQYSIRRTNLFGLNTYGLQGTTVSSHNVYTPTNKYILDTSIPADDTTTIETPLCVNDNFPITFYFDAIDFGNTNMYDWTYSKGGICRVLPNTPGFDASDMINAFVGTSEYNAINGAVGFGTKLVMKKEIWRNDIALLDYCLSIDDYTDYHCNGVMFDYCSNGNLGMNKCVAWMDGTAKQNKSIGLDLYLPYCQTYLNRTECTFFSQTSLEYNPYYRDSAIREYCKTNINDRNCDCANSNIIPNNLVTSYLGPKACWLSGCTLKNLDYKYIYTEDLKTKESCKVSGCSISIGNLTLSSDASINVNLINQCLSQNNQKQIIGNNQNDRFQFSERDYPVLCIYLIPMLLFVIIVIFIQFFLKKNVYSEVGNVNKSKAIDKSITNKLNLGLRKVTNKL